MSDIQTTAAPDGWKPTGGAGTVPKLVVPTHIDGLSGEENALLRELAAQYAPVAAGQTLAVTVFYRGINAMAMLSDDTQHKRQQLLAWFQHCMTLPA